MADTDNPLVKRFHVYDVMNQDDVEILLGPQAAFVKTCKWPRDENGKVTDMGAAQTITISRAAMIGLAYEILETVKKQL